MTYKTGDNYYENMVAAQVAKTHTAKRNKLYHEEDVMAAMSNISPEEAALYASRGELYDTTAYDYEITNEIELTALYA